MSRIITDTGIWYQNLSHPKYQGMLTCTFINFYELAHSENMYKKTEKWKQALKNLATIPCYAYYTSPIEYIIKGDDEACNIAGFNNLIEIHEAFAFALNNDIIGWNENIKEWLSDRNKIYYDSARYMEKLIVESRRKAKANHLLLDGYSIADSIPLFREKFCDAFLSNHYHKIDINKIDWNEFELLERAGTQFFYEMETSNLGWQVNDFYDLCNLIYVSPRDHYYVKEKKWIELIKRAGMSKYLFPAL